MYHTLVLVGNVGRDPEMRYTPSGQPVTSFSVATNRQYTNNNGETIKETIWFRITTWGKQAEVCNQYLRKGSKVLVEGRLTPDKDTGGPRIWTKQDGTPGASFEVLPALSGFYPAAMKVVPQQAAETWGGPLSALPKMISRSRPVGPESPETFRASRKESE
jgi:single-strand DNA-binding protein